MTVRKTNLACVAALGVAALTVAGGCATSPPAASTAEPAAAAEPAAVEPAATEETAYKNTIRWTTASEVDNFGFDVFRSESEDGPFERINAETIEGAGTTDEPSKYVFVDDAIDPRKTYWYYVESISMAGVREKFTPTGKAPPKIPPPAEDADGAEADGGAEDPR